MPNLFDYKSSPNHQSFHHQTDGCVCVCHAVVLLILCRLQQTVEILFPVKYLDFGTIGLCSKNTLNLNIYPVKWEACKEWLPALFFMIIFLSVTWSDLWVSFLGWPLWARNACTCWQSINQVQLSWEAEPWLLLPFLNFMYGFQLFLCWRKKTKLAFSQQQNHIQQLRFHCANQ